MTKIIFFFGNWIPTFFTIGLILIVLNFHQSTYLLPLILFYIYFIPVILYRILNAIFKKESGKFPVGQKDHLLWWYGIQLQAIFSRFGFFEEVLRIVPMVYSAWLRLWGAKLGKFIFWSPKVLIADRGDIEIGDFCVIGFGVKFTSHLISKSHNKDVFLFSKIKIEERVIVGAETNIGPGVIVHKDISIAALSTLLPFSSWKDSKEYTPREK